MAHETVTIANEQYKAVIALVGAELKSVTDSKGTEFMWQADSDVWPRTAPVLFPIVGKVKQDSFRVNGVSFPLSQHGFARDHRFTVLAQTETKVIFQLNYSIHTLKHYPFDFKLILSYEWMNHELVCGYEVINTGVVHLPFSIGAHPGFNLPSGHLSDYYLEFNQVENLNRHLLEEGLFNHQTETVMQNTKVLALSEELFEKDAIVFKHMQSNEVTLKDKNSNYAVKMNYEGFPFFGIWTKKGCQRFICLEPWFGHADDVNGHLDALTKPGMQVLAPKENFKTHYTLRFFS
jgi:galactose mutarotase-like enzyme